MTDWNLPPSVLLTLLLVLSLISLATLVGLCLLTRTLETLKFQNLNLKHQMSALASNLENHFSMASLLTTSHSESSKELTKLIDKQMALLASKGPLEYQAVQLMNQQNLEVVSDDYDPSDAAEIERLKERGSLNDVYGNDWSGIDEPQFSITDQENLGAGAPYIAGLSS